MQPLPSKTLTEINPKPKPIKQAKIKKAKKVNKRKLLVKLLDATVKEIVLDRDHHCVCEAPKTNGHSMVRQPGHLISRTKESVRWSLWNVHEQCSSCNYLHEHAPHRFTSWFLETFGADKYWQLCQEADAVCKLQIYELEELLCQLMKIREKQLKAMLLGEPYKPYYSQREILSGAWSNE